MSKPSVPHNETALSPPPPPQAPPLSAEYKAGKLQAYKLICEMMTRHQDVLPNREFMVHLYHIMHKGISSDDQVQPAGGTYSKAASCYIFHQQMAQQSNSCNVHVYC